MICEICGNEFYRKPLKRKDGSLFVKCIYCESINDYTPARKGERNDKHRNNQRTKWNY